MTFLTGELLSVKDELLLSTYRAKRRVDFSIGFKEIGSHAEKIVDQIHVSFIMEAEGENVMILPDDVLAGDKKHLVILMDDLVLEKKDVLFILLDVFLPDDEIVGRSMSFLVIILKGYVHPDGDILLIDSKGEGKRFMIEAEVFKGENLFPVKEEGWNLF